MRTLAQDLKFALRMFLKNAGFTAVVVFTLALGIGVNTAIFSIVSAVLLHPLPYDRPELIYHVWDNNLQRNVAEALISYPKFNEWKGQSESFEAIAAYAPRNFNLKGESDPEQVEGARVSADFFNVLGVPPALGRTFSPAEDEPGGDSVVILSDDLWRNRFGQSEQIIGQPITLDGKAVTVIGVMPPGFHFPTDDSSVWVPRVYEVSTPAADRIKQGAGFLAVIARLKSGVKDIQALKEIEAVNERYRQHYSGHIDVDNGSKLVPLQEQIVGDIKPALLILQGAVLFVLLIACANVTSLVLARSTARQKEISIRVAMGATRLRIIRQLLVENVMLSLAGGALGLLLAFFAIKSLVAMDPGNIPRVSEVGLDGTVLFFTLSIALLTGIIVGLAPALHASSANLNDALKESRSSSTPGLRRNRLGGLIIVTEVALALTLLIGGGLLIQSFARLLNVNPGFDPKNVLTMQITLPRSRYSAPGSQANFFQQVIRRAETLPGVQSAGAISFLPLAGGNMKFFYNIEGRTRLGPGKDPLTSVRVVSPNYFQAIGMPVLRGRPFTDQDMDGRPKAVIINETMARRSFPDEDPLGKRLAISSNYGPDGWLTIVGIAGDIKHANLETESPEEIYLPFLQAPWPSMSLVVRAAPDPMSLAGPIRNEVFAIDKDQPVFNVRSMEEVISSSVAQPRFTMFLLGTFASVAIALAALGIYGVMAYSVTQRMQEIGIRMALGASHKAVLKLIVGQGMLLTIVGVVIGLGLAFYATSVMKSLLFGVGVTDPITFLFAPLGMIAVALLACFIPARRAMKVDPLIALRHE